MGIRCNFLLFLFAEKHFSTLNTFFTTARWRAVRSASSSQSAARTQLCQHWGVDMEMFPMWSKHFKPWGWLTNTSHSSVARICRTKHHFFFLFFFFSFFWRERSCLWFWWRSLSWQHLYQGQSQEQVPQWGTKDPDPEKSKQEVN